MATLDRFGPALYSELWLSLASLLRSYAAAHGLHNGSQAAIEVEEERIAARHGARWLELRRTGATIVWKRDNGSSGTLELTQTGRLRSAAGETEGASSEQEMDMTAEAWARDLMRELK